MQYRIFVLLGCNSVAGNVVRDVSKEPFAYILMYLESLKTKATRSFETSINPYSSTQGHITKAVNLRETSSCGYIYETLRYFRSYSGNSCHSVYCCASRYTLFPAGGGTPLQLCTGRRRMKISYFRSWGRHQKSATLPRSLRIQLGQWLLCVILLCRCLVQTESLRSD